MESSSDNVIHIGGRASSPARQMWNFDYPHQVVSSMNLSRAEKRAVPAAWAYDVHAIESYPTLRHLPGTPFPVTFSSIMDARMQLDKLEACNDDDPPPKHPAMLRRVVPLREAA
jgi:hypothetical protein